MDDYEKMIHVKELARKRQKKFYEANKEKIKQRKREQWQTLKTNAALIRENMPNRPILFEEQQEPEPEQEQEPIIIQTTRTGKEIIDYEFVKSQFDKIEISSGSKKKYLDDLKILLRITSCDDLSICLKNTKKIISDIENANQLKDTTKKYSINSKKGLFQSIIYLIDKLKINVTKKIRAVYLEQFERYKIQSNTEDRQKGLNDEILDFNIVIDRIKNKFKEDSKQYLLIMMYNAVTCRDNYSNLKIIENRNDVKPKQNYVLVPKNKSILATIILQVYKTAKKEGSIIEETCDKTLSSLIRDYISAKKLSYSDPLFGQTKLSGFVGAMMRNIGIEKGSINYIRTSKLSTELAGANIMDAATRLKFAKLSQHSAITQLRYLRKLMD
jgi:hypothetical protein